MVEEGALELPPQTRRLLDLLDGIVNTIAAEQDTDREAVRVTRRQIREPDRLGRTPR